MVYLDAATRSFNALLSGDLEKSDVVNGTMVFAKQIRHNESSLTLSINI